MWIARRWSGMNYSFDLVSFALSVRVLDFVGIKWQTAKQIWVAIGKLTHIYMIACRMVDGHECSSMKFQLRYMQFYLWWAFCCIKIIGIVSIWRGTFSVSLEQYHFLEYTTNLIHISDNLYWWHVQLSHSRVYCNGSNRIFILRYVIGESCF